MHFTGNSFHGNKLTVGIAKQNFPESGYKTPIDADLLKLDRIKRDRIQRARTQRIDQANTP